MRLFFAGLALALLLACSPAYAQPLAGFSSGSMHMQIGTNALAKIYVKNGGAQFANVTVFLGGDYPSGLAEFANVSGAYFSADMRSAVVGLNPQEGKTLQLVIISTVPKEGGYTINLDANTTASGETSSGSMKVLIDYAPSFPGLESLGILLLLALSGLAYWRIR